MKKLLVIIFLFLILPLYNYTADAAVVTYMEDFEKATDTVDYVLGGNTTGKNIVDIDNNKSLLLSRQANATDSGWVDKTFSPALSGDVVLELKIKSTSKLWHQILLYKAGVAALLGLDIADGICNFNGVGVRDLPNRGDGKFHSYKFVIKNSIPNSTALIDFYYDNNIIYSNVSSPTILTEFNTMRITLGGGNTASEIYVDNIAIYSLSTPIPSPVQCSSVGGTIKLSDKITLSGEDGVNIYYTLDGSEPNQFSNLYTGPFSLRNDNVTIRAIAIKNNVSSFVANFGPFYVDNFIFKDFEDTIDGFFEVISGNAPTFKTVNFNNMALLGVGQYKIPFESPFTNNMNICFWNDGNSEIKLYNGSFVVGSFIATTGSYNLNVDFGNKIILVNKNELLQETININESQLTAVEFLSSTEFIIDDFAAYKTSSTLPSPVVCSTKPGYIPRGEKIVLSADVDAVIRYTLDGTIPNATSVIYSGPILPSSLKTVIKAKAFKDGKESFSRAFGEFKIDNSYQYDFENYNENNTINSIGFFDESWGHMSTNKVVKENGNGAIYFERNTVDDATGAWIQKTFPVPFSNDFIFQFKMKSNVSEFKQVTIPTNVSGKMVTLNLSPGGCTINGQTINVPDFSDGNYHQYQFHIKFSENGASVDFYYDNKILKGDIILGNDVSNFSLFRITLTKAAGSVPNSAYIDDLMLYFVDNPYPATPRFSDDIGEVDINKTFSLFAEEGADIYYSIDGSYPVIDEAHRYTQPFVLRNKINYIKAIAVKNGKQSTAVTCGPFTLKNIDGILLLSTPVFNSDSPTKVTACTAQVKNLENFTKNIVAIICLYKNNELISISQQEFSISQNFVQSITANVIADNSADKAVFYIWSDKNTTFAPISTKTIMR